MTNATTPRKKKGPAPRTPEQLVAAFWSYVDRSGGVGVCWPWTAFRYPGGYGQFHVARRPVYAHRFAWANANAASILPGFEIRHACDNPPCCNPAHLAIGTKSQNARDAVERGRHRHFRGAGEDNPRAKLTAANVETIRAMLITKTRREVAALFGVRSTTISNIALGRSWRAAAGMEVAP